MFSETPQLTDYAGLETDCRETTAEQQAAHDQDHRNQSARDDTQQAQQQEQEDVVDPDDPLFGLDYRLKDLNLDEESKRIIKVKLQEASAKIKAGLE